MIVDMDVPHDPRVEYPKVEWDDLRTHLLEKVEGVSVKQDGWVESSDTFWIDHMQLDKEQETELFYFLMDYPDITIGATVTTEGYRISYHITEMSYPFRHNMHEAFTQELESTVLISGVLYKESRDVDVAKVEIRG